MGSSLSTLPQQNEYEYLKRHLYETTRKNDVFSFENCLQDLPNPDVEFFTWILSCAVHHKAFHILMYIQNKSLATQESIQEVYQEYISSQYPDVRIIAWLINNTVEKTVDSILDNILSSQDYTRLLELFPSETVESKLELLSKSKQEFVPIMLNQDIVIYSEMEEEEEEEEKEYIKCIL
jgi:ribosomal protein L11 methylase PrmA